MTVSYTHLEKEIQSAVGKTLENVTLLDVYEGNQIERGKKSVAFSLKLRSKMCIRDRE